MDPAEIKMIENLQKTTGKSLEEWKAVVNSCGLNKHGEMVKYLKTEFGLWHGYANLVVHKTFASDAGSSDDKSQLIENQYKGKENLRPWYDQLVAAILPMGEDIDVVPKNSSVSFRRKKQFCLLEPKTKTRLELGLNMKNVEALGKLETCPPGGMCPFKIRIEKAEDIDGEVFGWIQRAYEQAG